MELTLVILAAGVGSRYGGVKQLDGVGPSGETIMDYSIHDAINAGFDKVVFIIRKDLKETFEAHYEDRFNGKIKIEIAFQDAYTKYTEAYDSSRLKPWGTAHAMLAASHLINGPFVIINADDFYGAGSFQLMADAFKNSKDGSEFFMAGYKLKNTLSDHGTVSRGYCQVDNNNFLSQITELTKVQRKAGNEVVFVKNDKEETLDDSSFVSMNFWGFTQNIFATSEELMQEFVRDNHADPKSEFLIPDVVDKMIQDKTATVEVLPTDEQWIGVTYKEDRPIVVAGLKEKVAKGLYPNKLG